MWCVFCPLCKIGPLDTALYVITFRQIHCTAEARNQLQEKKYINHMPKNKNLIIYDSLLINGGAESLTLTLCEAVENLDLCVGFVNRDCFVQTPIISGLLTELIGATKIQGWQSIKLAFAFEQHKVSMISKYEKVIFSGASAPLAVKFRSQGSNLLYCHTPPRFIYDLKQYYLSVIPFWQKPLLKLLIAYLQPKYETSVDKMDLIIANSINSQRRLKKHLNKDAIVIYPPCHTDKYSWLSQGDYYLSTARVEPYKRIRLIVEAFKTMPDKKLVVASGGTEIDKLKALAKGHSNIRFTGWCDGNELKTLMGNCIATLYLPIDEDFGISPVESMAAGKPVIGVYEGGVIETVLDGTTGLLCPSNPSSVDVINAVTEMSPEFALSLRVNCEQRAKLFTSQIFIDKMKMLLDCHHDELLTIAKEVDAS